MRKASVLTILVCLLTTAHVAPADTFGYGANQFTIDFVPISGDAGNLGNWAAGYGYTFSGVNHGNYRMGKYEITNDQWTKFKAAYGVVLGIPTTAYNENPYYTGSSVPTNRVSWYEAAQFVNWLNMSKNYPPAYKFTGPISYTLGVWSSQDADGTNLYRNKNAKYFLPTENEWVKAAYWNGSNLQTWATIGDVSTTLGNGSNGGWNYYSGIGQPWSIGSGSQELNGTYDMMGNVYEWMESPYHTGNYLSDSPRGLRGGAYSSHDINLASSYRDNSPAPDYEFNYIGFRVASIPEPTTLLLLGLGGMMIRKR